MNTHSQYSRAFFQLVSKIRGILRVKSGFINFAIAFEAVAKSAYSSRGRSNFKLEELTYFCWGREIVYVSA
jgi:hypothetical protein